MIKKLLLSVLLFSFYSVVAQEPDRTFVPDNKFEQALIDLGYDDVLDDYVLTSNIVNVTSLRMNFKGISSLEGIENFTSIKSLDCRANLLGSLDLSQNTDLEYLNVDQNRLSELDLSNQPKLRVLECNSNNLSKLDFSTNLALKEIGAQVNGLKEIILPNNRALTELDLGSNGITSINLSNQPNLLKLDLSENNIHQIDLLNNLLLEELILYRNTLTALDLTNNPNLTKLSTFQNSLSCIKVADVIKANQIPNKDIRDANFATSCATTSTKIYVPDDSFEQALIDKGYDDVLDDYVTVINIELIKELNLSRRNSPLKIEELTGIEAFSELERLEVSYNNLENIDISNLTKLKTFLISDNKLDKLDVSKNLELELLLVQSNDISNIDVSKNLKLKELFMSSTLISKIDISLNSALERLSIEDTKLAELDLSDNNRLRSLFVRNNPSLTCIQVADISAANAQSSWRKDDTAQYSLDCFTPNTCTASGTILMERYDNINGSAISDLLDASYYYPLRPSLITELSSFEIEQNQLDKYGVRVSGYLCPPETGTYYFYVAGNNHTELNLSTTERPANKVRIAHHESWTSNRQWNKFATQKSQGIRLEKGRPYYIEALMKEDTFGDNLAVGWRKPSEGNGALASEVIPGDVLSPSIRDYTSVTGISISPSKLTISEDEATRLTASISPADATYRRSIVWSTSDASIVSVDRFGRIKGLSQGTATITVKANDGGFTAQTDITVLAGNQNACTASGTILIERYDEISGITIANLLDSKNYPDNPSSSSELPIFEIQENQGDNYGVRVSGYLCPPETGTYNFWIAGNNSTELNLSTTSDKADKVRIAYNDTYVNASQFRRWTKFPSQRSEGIYLVKGNRYYIEALMKEGTAGDNLSVAWRKPSDFVNLFPTEVIPGSVLSPITNSSTSLTASVSEVSNQKENEPDLTISPNPASTEVNIVISNFSNVSEIEYTIFTLSGSEVISLTGTSRQTIDVSSLTKGTYQLVARSGSWSKGENLIVR